MLIEIREITKIYMQQEVGLCKYGKVRKNLSAKTCRSNELLQPVILALTYKMYCDCGGGSGDF